MAEIERRPNVGTRQMIKVGNLLMDKQTARIVEEEKREREARLEKRREDLQFVKTRGKKETLDVEHILRSKHSGLSDQEMQKILTDKRKVEEIEMEYYLDTPDWVVNLETYTKWIISMLG